MGHLISAKVRLGYHISGGFVIPRRPASFVEQLLYSPGFHSIVPNWRPFLLSIVGSAHIAGYGDIVRP